MTGPLRSSLMRDEWVLHVAVTICPNTVQRGDHETGCLSSRSRRGAAAFTEDMKPTPKEAGSVLRFAGEVARCTGAVCTCSLCWRSRAGSQNARR